MFDINDLSEVKNVGMFIDGENISYKDIEYVFEEIKKYGRIIVKRVYCDWKTKQAENWVQKCQNFGIEETHCAKVPKKSSVDFKLVDDIYDFLYVKKTIDIFVLASNDGDFVSVIRKARSFGKFFIVIGYNFCSDALKNTSDIFISIDVLKNKNSLHLGKNIIKKNIQVDECINEINEINEINDEKTEEDELSLIKGCFSEEKKVLSFLEFEEKILKDNNFKIDHIEELINKKYNDQFLIKNGNNKRKNIYDISAIDSVQYKSLYDQIRAIFIHFNCEEMALTILKEKLVLLTTKFDQRMYGFQKFKDFIETLFSDKFIFRNEKNMHVIIKLIS